MLLKLPQFAVCRKPFLAAGCVGLALAASLLFFLVPARGLSPLVMTIIVAVGVAALLGTPLVLKIFTGVERFVFFRDMIVIMAAVATALKLLHQPALPYLDVMIAGSGVFHACGRIGCLLAGCCHGRVSRWGVRYSPQHSKTGFPAQLVGVTLFPIQAVESAFVLCLTATATVLILKKCPPGTAFAFYVIGYALGRFWIELARGDAERPYFLGFSQAQWIALLLAIAVVSAGQAGILPASPGHVVAAAGLLLSMLLIAVWRRLEGARRFDLLHARHVLEIAGGLRQLAFSSRQPNADRRRKIDVVRTSLGMQISAGQTVKGGQSIRHYSFSKAGSALHFRAARALGDEIALLEHSSGPFELIAGSAGVFHLLLRPIQTSGSHAGQKT